MSNLRVLAATCVGALALLVSGVQQVGADPILGVIDIRPILARHPDSGNSLGIAYNPTSDVIYLAHGGGGPGSFIYTLDIHGTLLHELNFQSAYRPESFPGSLSYDRDSSHLFVFACCVGEGIGSIVEMSPDGSTIFSEFTVPLGGGGGIVVRDDGIWQSLFASDIIRHYTRNGVFIEDVSVAESFPGFSGADDLTSSFTGGFFIVDLFGGRIVEVDTAGTELAAVSTATVGSGLAIDADVNTQRIFLQVNNEEIFILSSEFLRQQIVNNFVTFQPIQSTFMFTPNTTGCPVGFAGKFSFDARLVNVSDQSLTSLTIEVNTLSNDNLLQNADGGPGGVDAQLTVPQQDGFIDGVLIAEEFVDVPFIICLTQQRSFTFRVDVLGVLETSAEAHAQAQLVR